jgi:hypothetical protein
LKGRDHLEDLGIDGKIKLEYILEKWDESESESESDLPCN